MLLLLQTTLPTHPFISLSADSAQEAKNRLADHSDLSARRDDVRSALLANIAHGTSSQKVIVLVLLRPSIKLPRLMDFAAEIRRLKREEFIRLGKENSQAKELLDLNERLDA